MPRNHGLYFVFVGEAKCRQSRVHDFSGVVKTVTGWSKIGLDYQRLLFSSPWNELRFLDKKVAQNRATWSRMKRLACRFSNFMLAITAGVCLWGMVKTPKFDSQKTQTAKGNLRPCAVPVLFNVSLASSWDIKKKGGIQKQTLFKGGIQKPPETWYWYCDIPNNYLLSSFLSGTPGSHFIRIPFNLTEKYPLTLMVFFQKHGSKKVTKPWLTEFPRHHFDMKPETVQNLRGLPFGCFQK